jgi:hypothetical protein
VHLFEDPERLKAPQKSSIFTAADLWTNARCLQTCGKHVGWQGMSMSGVVEGEKKKGGGDVWKHRMFHSFYFTNMSAAAIKPLLTKQK